MLFYEPPARRLLLDGSQRLLLFFVFFVIFFQNNDQGSAKKLSEADFSDLLIELLAGSERDLFVLTQCEVRNCNND